MAAEHVDKRSESQFVGAGSTVLAPAKTGEGGSWIHKAGTGRTVVGTPQDVMKSVASEGRLFEGHNKVPKYMKTEGAPDWVVETSTSTRPGGFVHNTATKAGRAAVAKDLGLPNKKEFRKKQGK